MRFSILLNIIARLRRTPRLTCPRPLWIALLEDLRRRGGGEREAGAFLLGRRRADGSRSVEGYIPYDEVDPRALRGIIVFDGSLVDQVWERCAALGLGVVADVHTHPGGYGQSDIDQANPMIPQAGHLALIVPNYADRAYEPGQIGQYEFRGKAGWIDHSPAGSKFFQLKDAK